MHNKLASNMKKVIAIYGRVKITKQPEWLPAFLARFQKTPHWEPHVTLKQSCFVEEGDIPVIRRIVDDFFEKNHYAVIPAVFDKVLANPEWPYILLSMKYSEKLVNLQTALVQILKGYRGYIEPELEEYEKNFNPHLTIADSLDREQTKVAIRELSGGCMIRGIIDEIVLIVVENPEYAEIDRELNYTTYKL